MENIFQAVGYLIFGKRWVLWNMKHGIKTALFVNEIEIEMNRNKIKDAQARSTSARSELEALKATPLKEPASILPESEKENKKSLYDAEQKLKHERSEAMRGLEMALKEAETDIQLADGELSRIYSITYSNRRKYDFVRDYKIKPSYADRPKSK